jgi:hypothetical protein
MKEESNLEELKLEVTAAPGCNDLTIRHGEAKKIYQPSGTAYKLDTIDAIAELVKFRGTTEKTLIFCNEEKIGIILDDSIMDRSKDLARFAYSRSDEFDEWAKVLDRPLNQKQFVDFLKLRQPEEIIGLEGLLAQVQYLQYATSIVGDFSYEDRDNITVGIKIKDSETTTKIPQQFIVTIPLVFGSDKKVSIEIQLELQKPRSETEKPTFTLTCPKFNRYWNEAVNYEVDRLKKLLPGYQIIAGSME